MCVSQRECPSNRPAGRFFSRRIVMLTSVMLLYVVAVMCCSMGEGVTVSVTRGVLPQSKQVAQSPRMGHWVHGDSIEADAAFFKVEDDANAAWQERKRELLRAAATAEAGGKTDDADADKGDGDDAPGAPNGAAGLDEGKVRSYFAPGSMLARRAALRTLFSRSSNASVEERVGALHEQTTGLRSALLGSTLGGRTPSFLGRRGYSRLLGQCFRHAVVPIVMPAETPSTAATSTVSPPQQGMLPMLPDLFIANWSTLVAARRQLDSLKVYLAELPEEGEDTAAGTTTVISANLGVLSAMLDHSETALRSIYALSKSLYLDGIAAAAHESQVVQRRIVENDEATEALRKEMKQLTQARSRLRSWENELRSALRHTRRAETIEALDRTAFSTEEMAAVGLVLIADMRIGCKGEVSVLTPLPEAPLPTVFTGLRVEDFELQSRPLLHIVLFFSFVVVATREIQLWTLEGALQSAPLRSANKRSLRNKLYRASFRFSNFLLSVLPLLWVAWEVLRLHRSGNVPFLPFFAFIKPHQRIGGALLVVAAVLTAKTLATLLCMLPSFVGNAPERRRPKKTD